MITCIFIAGQLFLSSPDGMSVNMAQVGVVEDKGNRMGFYYARGSFWVPKGTETPAIQLIDECGREAETRMIEELQGYGE